MSQEPSEVHAPPLALGNVGRYRTPLVVQAQSGKMADTTGPIHIHLALEGGYELEIPMTQEALNGLYQIAKSLTTRP